MKASARKLFFCYFSENICELYKQGKTPREIAYLVHGSTNHIRTILKSYDLFQPLPKILNLQKYFRRFFPFLTIIKYDLNHKRSLQKDY
jgi:hypothetical protein